MASVGGIGVKPVKIRKLPSASEQHEDDGGRAETHREAAVARGAGNSARCLFVAHGRKTNASPSRRA